MILYEKFEILEGMMNKENDKNVDKYKQILNKIVLSHFLGEEK